MYFMNCECCEEVITGEPITYEDDVNTIGDEGTEIDVLKIRHFCSEECKQEFISLPTCPQPQKVLTIAELVSCELEDFAEALKDYEGDEFIVNSAMVEFMEGYISRKTKV